MALRATVGDGVATAVVDWAMAPGRAASNKAAWATEICILDDMWLRSVYSGHKFDGSRAGKRKLSALMRRSVPEAWRRDEVACLLRSNVQLGMKLDG